MMMESNNVRYHSAVIFVRDIAAAKHFYIDVLGMEIDMDFGTNVGLKGGLSLWQPSRWGKWRNI
jgi:catechol 2,3-dioxygenase-like lactoylglutathione lyase family enzyme